MLNSGAAVEVDCHILKEDEDNQFKFRSDVSTLADANDGRDLRRKEQDDVIFCSFSFFQALSSQTINSSVRTITRLLGASCNDKYVLDLLIGRMKYL